MMRGDEAAVCSLVETVFNEFVAPDYAQEGIREFFKFANPEALAGRAVPEQVVVVAEHESRILGMIEMTRRDHVSMLFVSRQGQGIAKRLVRMAIDECRGRWPDLTEITVNSSPFAEPAYRRLGFHPTAPRQEKNGIVFIPMRLPLPMKRIDES